jgi:hypothetical protein
VSTPRLFFAPSFHYLKGFYRTQLRLCEVIRTFCWRQLSVTLHYTPAASDATATLWSDLWSDLNILLKTIGCYTPLYTSRGGIKIFKALARLARNWKFLLAKSENKTCHNHVFAEHLYSVHFVNTKPTRKIDHHDCVCVIIINNTVSCVCLYFGIGEE